MRGRWILQTMRLSPRAGKVHLLLIVSSLLCLALTVWLLKVFLEYRAKNPTPVERDAIAAVRAQDWGTLYDLAPTELWAEQGITRDQVVTLFRSVTAKAPPGAFDGMKTEPLVGGAADNAKGLSGVFLAFPNAPKRPDGLVAGDVIHTYRTRDGWRTDLGRLPVIIALWSDTDRKRAWATFAVALEQANIRDYPMRARGMMVDRKKLDAYLAGRCSEDDIYVRRH